MSKHSQAKRKNSCIEQEVMAAVTAAMLLPSSQRMDCANNFSHISAVRLRVDCRF